MKRINLVYLLVLMGFFIFSCTNNLNNKSSIDDFIAKESLQNSIAFRSAINIGQQHNEALEHIFLQYNGDLWNADTITVKTCQYFNYDPATVFENPDYYYYFQELFDSLSLNNSQDALDYILTAFHSSILELFELQIIGGTVKNNLLEIPGRIIDGNINWDSIKLEAVNLCSDQFELIVVESIYSIGYYSYSFWLNDYPVLVQLNPNLLPFEVGGIGDPDVVSAVASDICGGIGGAVHWTIKNWEKGTNGEWRDRVPEEDFWDLCGSMVFSAAWASTGSGKVGRLARRLLGL